MVAETPEAIFEAARPALLRVAYRMLGSMTEAEDAVQEAWLRWSAVDHDTIREPAAFLRRTVMRICLDVLKSARVRREQYVGPWLPEPVVEDQAIEDVTLPLLLALERLSPLERAAFLLHDVFGLDFDEVATTIGREPAACRQLASRARDHVRADRPRFPVPKQHGLEIAEAFFAASRNGDMERLRGLLAADVTLYADGGGKVPAGTVPLAGLDDVMALFARFVPALAANPSRLVRYGLINGLPGFVTVEHGGLIQTTALEIGPNGIVAVYITRNPDKLKHMSDALH
jgi:RNA polymerase sigma-70 factor (ECF subfamily)